MLLSVDTLTVGARSSPLSRAQVDEVFRELALFYPVLKYEAVWMATTGDLDLQTSLKGQEKTDFFTREIDQALLHGKTRIAIHSAKDLPDPLPKGLQCVALTKGVSPADSLVYNIDPLPYGARIGTSSIRREENLRSWRSDLVFIDIRGTIEQRLEKLDKGELEGVVIAEAALIRLRFTERLRWIMPFETAPLQGRLAVLAREEDREMKELFASLDTR